MHHLQYRVQLWLDAGGGGALWRAAVCRGRIGLAVQLGGQHAGGLSGDGGDDRALSQRRAIGAARRVDTAHQALLSGVAGVAGVRHVVQCLQAVYGRHHRYPDGDVDSAGRQCHEYRGQLSPYLRQVGIARTGLVGRRTEHVVVPHCDGRGVCLDRVAGPSFPPLSGRVVAAAMVAGALPSASGIGLARRTTDGDGNSFVQPEHHHGGLAGHHSFGVAPDHADHLAVHFHDVLRHGGGGGRTRQQLSWCGRRV